MDTVWLFALPLVGGLIFSSNWNYTRYDAAREEGHRLYFRAVFYGALLFAAMIALRVLLNRYWPLYRAAEEAVREVLAPMAKDADDATAVAVVSVTCFYAMIVGWPAAHFLNLFFDRGVALRKAMKRDEFESLLLNAADRKLPIAVTMDDGKVYVGFVVETSYPTEARKFLSMLPLVSGYRSEKHKIEFTTYYMQIYGQQLRDGHLPPPLEHLRPEDFITVVPVEKIVSSRLFDSNAYGVFNKPENAPASSAATPPGTAGATR